MITASFTTGTLGITQGTGVTLVDGVRAGTFDAGVSNSTLEVDVPVAGSGYRDVELPGVHGSLRRQGPGSRRLGPDPPHFAATSDGIHPNDAGFSLVARISRPA